MPCNVCTHAGRRVKLCECNLAHKSYSDLAYKKRDKSPLTLTAISQNDCAGDTQVITLRSTH